VTIRDAEDGDLDAIARIFNEEVETGTASWTVTPRSVATFRVWRDERRAGGFPVLVSGRPALGYASYGPFRAGEGYRFTVEHSVYVAAAARRQGIARRLLVALVARAREAGFRRMVGGVSADQPASIALHRALGFEEQGRLLGIGEKHGRRLDLALFVLDLETPGWKGGAFL
jgi:phosphinothricin acetyltransferase